MPCGRVLGRLKPRVGAGRSRSATIQMVTACKAAGMRIEEIAGLQYAFPTFTKWVSQASQMLVRELGVRAMPQLWSSLPHSSGEPA